MADAGSTPFHPDEQLERLAEYFLGSDLPFKGVSFIKFARVPDHYGFERFSPFRLIFQNGVSRWQALQGIEKTK